jgi:hypothetical protein
MTKQEFLERLRLALNGRVEPSVVADNLSYYEDYISTEIRKGKSEEEVLDLLGDPRLIARTILETMPGTEKGADYRRTETGRMQEDRRENVRTEDLSEDGQVEGQFWRGLIAKMPNWLWSVILLIAVVFIIGVVCRVLAFLAPVLIAAAVVLFLVKLFRDWF